MNDNAIIFLAITLGFTLLVIVIRFFPFGVLSISNQPSMYYRLNLAEQKITTIPFRALKEDMNKLFEKDYELIRLPALTAFINHKTNLSKRSFFVAVNESCIYTLIKALPVLKKEKVLIIIFIPVFLISSNNRSQEIQSWLQQFIFSEDFKNKSDNTQLKSLISHTI